MDSAGTVAAAWSRLRAQLEQSDDSQLKSAILDYRAAVVDMSEENYKLSEQLRAELQRTWVSDEFVIERNAAWRKTEGGGREGAYCSACLEGQGRAVHLTMTSTGLRCPYCDAAYQLAR
jgi:hypothetical protein